MKKVILAIISIAVLLFCSFSFVACDGNKKGENKESNSDFEEMSVKLIRVIER